jgi:lysozyme
MKYNMTELLDQLVEHEGLELIPYEDSLGIDTIGIGRNLEHRGLTEAELGYIGKDIHDKNFEEAKAQMLDSRWANQVGNRAVRLSNAMKSGEWV